jgi:hypothetical protein
MESTKSKALIQKYITINPIRTTETPFDDYELLKTFKNYRVSSVTIYWKKGQYSKGVQFKYQVCLPENEKKIVEGFRMMNVDLKKDIETLTYNLLDDEYLVEIWGRKGT